MCLSPILIRNTNRGLGHIGYNGIKDCESAFVPVPCGHCIDCIRSRQNDWIQRYRLETIDNYVAFCTLTYNNESLPRFEKEFISKDGELLNLRFDYADHNDIATLVRNLRQGSCYRCAFNNIDFKYSCFSELGGKFGRPHFHLLFFIPKKYFYDHSDFVSWCERHEFDVYRNWCRNEGTRKFPKWKKLCTYAERFKDGKPEKNYDFHAVVPNDDGNFDDVAFYVSKYLFKYSKKETSRQQFLKLNLTPGDYAEVYNIIKCKMTASKGIGSTASKYDPFGSKRTYLLDCVSRSKESNDDYKFLKFYNEDGKSFPLGRYFYHQQNLITPKDVIFFFEDLPSGEFKLPAKYLTKEQVNARISHHESILKNLTEYYE